MKLQSASLKEVKRIACGTVVGGIMLIAVMFVLGMMGIGVEPLEEPDSSPDDFPEGSQEDLGE